MNSPAQKPNRAAGWCAIAAAFLFLFSRTTGNLPIWGDDVFFLARAFVGAGGYLGIAGSRGYLTRFYSFVHEALGSDAARTHWFYIALLLLCTLLFHRIALRLFDRAAALVAAMFFLVYTGRMESVVWISAGAYFLVLLAILVSAWIIIETRWNLWGKAIAVSLLNWLPVHLYEFALIAAPLWPLLTLLHSRLCAKRVSRKDIAPTCLPLAMFAVHLAVLEAGGLGHPVWMRHPSWTASTGAVAAALWNAFYLGFSTSMGYVHAGLLAWSLRDLWMSPWTPWFLVTLAAAAGVTAFALRGPATHLKTHPALLATAAMYLILITPLIAFPIVSVHFPSRLLHLPGTGLALMAALAYRHAPFRRVVRAGVFAVIVMEGLSFNTLLFVYEYYGRIDAKIRRGILESGIRLQQGDAVYLSLPAAYPAWGPDKIIEPGWDKSSAHLWLLLDAGLVTTSGESTTFDRIGYFWERRGKSSPAPVAARAGRVYAFHVEEKTLRLIPMTMRDSRILHPSRSP